MLRALYDWTLMQARSRFAVPILGFISFIESSVFPIPPDVLLIPMVIANRARWFFYGLICTLASVAGAFLGYFIGVFLFDTIGQAIIDFYGKAGSFEKVKNWYETYGGWGVLIAAITPFPYKVLTIFSGAVGFNLATFAIVSLIGRGVRFFIIAYLLGRFGAPLQNFIEKRLGLLFTLFMIFLIGGFVVLHYWI